MAIGDLLAAVRRVWRVPVGLHYLRQHWCSESRARLCPAALDGRGGDGDGSDGDGDLVGAANGSTAGAQARSRTDCRR